MSVIPIFSLIDYSRHASEVLEVQYRLSWMAICLISVARLAVPVSDYPRLLLATNAANADAGQIISAPFEKYDKTTTIAKTEERLDAFAHFLNQNPHLKGYIVAYGGRRSCVGESRKRGAAAQAYLVNENRINPKRIVTMEGGYREAWVVELWVSAVETPPTSMPTVAPRKVRIKKVCKPPIQ